MRFIIASLALLFSASLAFSQTGKIDFRTLGLANSKMPELWAVEAGKAVPLAFSSAQPSAPLKADKTNPLKIFMGPLDDKGKPMDTSPILVNLPAASSILLLGWMEDEKPAFLAIEDAFATAKYDDWLVINHSNRPLTVQVGDTSPAFPLEANSHKTFKCTSPVSGGAAATVSTKQDDGSLKKVYSSFLPIFTDQRGMIVVTQVGERVRVKYIADQITRKQDSKR